MTRQLVAKFLEKSNVYKLQKNNYSMHHNPKMKLEPINMAYTSYEAISPQSQNSSPILILHGILGSKTNWNAMSRQISLKMLRKVIALDARNHGDSPHTKEFSYAHLAEDMREIMSELDIEEASLIGHSLGGRAMMAFALTNPDLVRDLIVVDISPNRLSSNANNLRNVLLSMKNIKLPSNTVTLMKAREAADEQLKLVIKNKHLRNFLLMNLALHEKQKKFYWKANIETLLDKFEEFVNFPFDGTFDKPTLFIAGSLSDYLIKQDEADILKKFPKAKFVYIENAGHLIHAEKPDMFLSTVSTFLEQQK